MNIHAMLPSVLCVLGFFLMDTLHIDIGRIPYLKQHFMAFSISCDLQESCMQKTG